MPRPLIELWNENNGNILLAMFMGILIVGASILVYEQNRFVPVSFPDAKSIRSQQTPGSATVDEPQLSIEITNAADDLGSIRLAVYQDEATFNAKGPAVFSQNLEIRDQRSVIAIPVNRFPSRFAVAAFHDEDGDGVLGTSDIGIPTERYGFSREARGITGPPKFSDAVIDRPVSDQTLRIVLK